MELEKPFGVLKKWSRNILNQQSMKHLKKIYKRIKVNYAHCADCGEPLSGNNSLANPFNCKCGSWIVDLDWLRETGFIELKLEEKNDKK